MTGVWFLTNEAWEPEVVHVDVGTYQFRGQNANPFLLFPTAGQICADVNQDCYNSLASLFVGLNIMRHGKIPMMVLLALFWGVMSAAGHAGARQVNFYALQHLHKWVLPIPQINLSLLQNNSCKKDGQFDLLGAVVNGVNLQIDPANVSGNYTITLDCITLVLDTGFAGIPSIGCYRICCSFAVTNMWRRENRIFKGVVRDGFLMAMAPAQEISSLHTLAAVTSLCDCPKMAFEC